MATTINSGYADSPKLTANIADHADVYGGRALVFDGVVDYLNCGSASSIDNIWAGGGTLSVWIYPHSGGEGGFGMIYAKRGGSGGSVGNIFHVYDVSGGVCDLRFYQYRATTAGDWTTTSREITLNEWNHVAVSFDSDDTSNNPSIYVNGKLVALTQSGSQSGASNSDASVDLYIGSDAGSYSFDGKMCDFKLFNSALTEAQVQELYKKPENTPSAVQDNLVAWYPMIEGNPESPQSIVYDHSEKKLGSENFQNESFETWDDADTINWWTHKDVNNNSGSGLISQVGSGETTGGSGTGSINFFASTSSNMSLTTPENLLNNNTLYKFVANVSRFEAGQLRLTLATNATVNLTSADVVNNQIVYYFVSGGTYYHYLRLSGAGVCDFTLDSVSIKEVQMGNHATTNFFGDELITNGDFASDANWTKGDGWSIGSGVATSDDSAQSATSYLKSASFTALSTSKTYRLSYTVVRNAGTVDFIGMGGSDSQLSHRTASGTYSEDFVPSGANTQIWVVSVDGGFDGTVDNISLKEVGISSSGFETAVNEPVVPQVPLMRYNQKMYFDGVDDKLNPSAPNLIVSDDWSISAWFVTDDISADQFIMAQTQSANNRIGICINSSGNVIANLWDGSAYYKKSSTAISVGTMNHVVFTNSNKTVNLYLNGVLQSGGINKGLSSVTGTFIGCKSSSSAFFNGVIEDVSFFNHTITSTEAQELFNDGVALDATTHSKANDYLLGYWRNDGVTTWTDRSDIQAIGFNGVSNNSIQNNNSIGNALGDNYTGDLSISVWFKRTEIGLSGGLVDIGYDAFDLGIFTLFINSSNELTFSLVDNVWNLKENFTDTDWNHVSAVYKAGSESDTKLYLNGSSVGTATGTFPSTSDMDVNGKSTFVGLYRSSGQSFTGIIGQTAIWTKELSSIEVSEIYNLGRRDTDLTTSYSTNLLAYYLLNPTHSNPDTTGSNNILDRSGNNHHASQVNGGIFFGTNDGDVQGSPDSITIREGLNQNKDGLGFYFTNPSSNVLRLNGANEYVSVPHTKSLVVGEQLTLECWAKLDRVTPSEDGTMISKYDEAGDSGREYSFQFPTDKRLIFRVSSAGSSATLKTLRADNAISDGNLWHHYAVTFASGTMKMYVDGSEVSASTSGATVTSIKQDGTANVVVGCVSTSSTPRHFFGGLIDEAKVYNRALSADEINKNYKHQKGKHTND